MPIKPDFPTLPAVPSAPTYENIIKALQAPAATESQFLPELESILSQRSQFLAPAISSLQQQQSTAQADLAGAFQRRGLTGSSIEAQALAGAAGAGSQALSNLLAQFSLGGAQTFASLVARARAGDVAAQRGILQALAQAMGEELGAQRDISLFREQLGFLGEEGERNRQAQSLESLLGLGGQLGAAYLMRGSGGAGSGSFLPSLSGLLGGR